VIAKGIRATQLPSEIKSLCHIASCLLKTKGLQDKGHKPMRHIPPDRRILYFARDRDTFGFLSHFWPAPIAIDGQEWPTVEHYYQAQKSADAGYRDAIRQAATPGMAKRLAAQPLRSATHFQAFLVSRQPGCPARGLV
jgi:NADAR domain